VLRYFGLSDVGCVRTSNEDAYAIEPELGLFVVADGMGGAQAGERASAVAIEAIVENIRRAFPDRSPDRLLDAVQAANRTVLQQASADPDLQGMGTTVVAVLVAPPAAHIASVGDSRAYLFRNGRLERITSDQTWVNEVGRSLGLTEEQIHTHPFRNVLTMAVGARERIEVHRYELSLQPADLLLLSSDGLHGVVSEESIAEALGAKTSLAAKAADLIEMARANGGPDNITAVLVENA
jgi:serine/threonine protein phosphatase PrpC